MDWSAAGAIGEVVGALAVVASLVYVAKQVRVSNRLARAEAWRSSNSDLNALNAAFGSDTAFRSGIAKVLGDGAVRDDLPIDERIAVSLYMLSVTNIYEQLFREVREGVLDEAALEFGGRSLFGTPFFRSSWHIYRPNLGASFVRYFEVAFGLGVELEEPAGRVDAL